ncbi:nuclear GTPase SLIP-GC-like isoform X2 [Betta splendens]|uniref:Nuclear GTPase SLIP-GC-like isoform X2 n=1 Tax=Betta splendens TaxID=158456 RepID=A0A6P7NAG1_BETSP|nr:nuclear GTPase SLIP-GC-like isoform X2 [Betta splendens]XP_029014818.1 nuclear GTPase SLIP-GC-like isoform X2 [Betta splendens]XP_029014819.1 nuclear GTPase SLIP-GC-like isoform X2 [Betta splendens]
MFLDMDEKDVPTTLREWGFPDWIEIFAGYTMARFLCLEDEDINKLIPHMGPSRATLKWNLKLLKGKHKVIYQGVEDVSNQEQAVEEAADCAQAGPSTSNLSNKGGIQKCSVRQDKRKSDLQGNHPPTKKRRDRDGPLSEEDILSSVKHIMENVYRTLHLTSKTRFKAFLKNKICDLKIDKREVIGVFGKTGDGKSSLINAVIEEFNLLPFGSIIACTSVMIKVEANRNPKYEAEIEFITPETWENELWSMRRIPIDVLKNDLEISKKLSVVYGEKWESLIQDTVNLIDNKYFKEIPEFLRHKSRTLICDSAKELKVELIQYTRSESSEVKVKRWYWPLVKCVTVRVPNNPLLQHVTLVDLPGNGDRNKSRNKMWKKFVGSCSTVWIVADINRAASALEAWEILEDACSHIGNGGQCQRIHFICTKTDRCENWKNEIVAARKLVFEEFNRQNTVKKYFSNECFKVFTVSSTEFKERTFLQPDETEIPKLQEFLRNLNDCHSETLNYVSGAYGILSLMQGARSRDTADIKAEVCSELEGKLNNELNKIRKTMRETFLAFKKSLTEGVENSKRSCEKNLQSVIKPKQSGSSFHPTLKCLVEQNGVHKTTKGKLINLNAKLCSDLTDSIDEEFRDTFPNQDDCSPFNGVISAFSLDTRKLIENYKAVKLQLIFLKTEEQNIQTRLNKIILYGKKTVYNSLTETVRKAMKNGYKEAAEFSGVNMLKNMRETLEKHFHASRDIMFEEAARVMLQNLKKLMEGILKELKETLTESIELSLKTDERLIIPDLAAELKQVEQYYNQLMDRN